mmetsp:Transcript_96044/g.228710  ORF Transcript_96044/g.228710 Transcript_96044/m.228710 type:complete len:404 (-) Transcript_96044:111-1322(-)
MYQLQSQEPMSDLENNELIGERSPGPARSSGCRWQCGTAVFLLGLVMVTAFAMKPRSINSAQVEEAVELQSEDPVWKQVLGNQAYKQYEEMLNKHEGVTASTSKTIAPSTTLATTTLATTLPTTMATTMATIAMATIASTSESTSTTTTLALGVPAMFTPAPTPATPPATATAAPLVFGSQDGHMSHMAEEFLDEAKKLDPKSQEHQSLQSVAQMLHRMSAPSTTSAPAESSVPLAELAPPEALDDGNKCVGDEEEFAGECYKKCGDLTGGYYPIRTSPFSCCASHPCGFLNSRIHVGFCSGFDVAGDNEGHGCPNFEGACLLDEEMFDGLCYKKCSLFPEGQTYNHRVAPNMCCSTHGIKCLLPKYFKFSADFAIGGGKNDGNAETPAMPHPPMKQLAELDA